MALTEVRFVAHCGLKSDFVRGPKSADFVAKLGWLRWRPTVSFGAADLDRPAVTLSTQLQRYAMHRTSVGGGRATSAASRRRF
jgi:hypothetical protein